MSDSCSVCRFFLFHTGENISVGICRRNPPAFNEAVFRFWNENSGNDPDASSEGFDWDEPNNTNADEHVLAHQFPMVRKWMWCGEFENCDIEKRGSEDQSDPPRMLKPIGEAETRCN